MIRKKTAITAVTASRTLTRLPERPYSYVKWTVVNEDGVTSYTDTGAYDPLKSAGVTGLRCYANL